MTVWFSSDHHLGHENILKYCDRPFKDVDHMNEILIVNHNAVVEPDDIVYFVGDVAMGQREKTVPLVGRFNGKKILIVGNHDDCHPMHHEKKKYQDMCQLYEEYFDDIIYGGYHFHEGFAVSHFPYNSGNIDYSGRDFSEWEPLDDGFPLLCGHVHEIWRVQNSVNSTFMFNVGVDVNFFAPVSFERVKEAYARWMMKAT